MHFAKKTGKIAQRLYVISILPLITFGLVVLILGYQLVSRAMYKQTESDMMQLASTINLLLDSKYPGDYHLEAGSEKASILLYKGESNITNDYSLINTIKESTSLDVTVFYDDTRILTTLHDENGKSLVGTGAASQIYDKVVVGGQPAFYSNTLINGVGYCSYYLPLQNEDGKVIGMLFIGKPIQTVEEGIRNALFPILILDLLVMFFMIFLVMQYTRQITVSMQEIHDFLYQAENAQETTDMPHVLKRNDELAEIGSHIISMHNSLQNMMNKDPLTKLFNRRSAAKKLDTMMKKSIASKTDFSLAIGDIDFFKKVNDTYGHDAGDLVLVKTAEMLMSHMHDCGFVARWGGEEFLLAFDKHNREQGQKSLEAFLEKIRAMEVVYGEQIIHITMSFGVSCWQGEPVDELIKSADDKLYFAKNNGRNQVVALLPTDEPEPVEDKTLADMEHLGGSEEENLNIAMAMLDLSGEEAEVLPAEETPQEVDIFTEILGPVVPSEKVSCEKSDEIVVVDAEVSSTFDSES